MWLRPSCSFIALAISVALGNAAYSQDGPVSMPTGEPKKDINDTPPVNPLQGLFQMQPQYPTPGTTQMFPEAVPAHMGSDGNVQGRNPGTPSTVFQQQFKDTDAKPAEKIERTDNGLKGLFQMQPQYPTPGTTQMFPEAVPKFLGDDSGVQGRNPGTPSSTYSVPWKDPYATPAPKSEDKTDYLKDLFQMQPQYPTAGTTTMFPTATSPQFGPDGSKPAQQPGTPGTLYVRPDAPINADVTPVMPGVLPGNQGGEAPKEAPKEAGEAGKSEGDKKEGAESGDKKEGEGDKKDGDKKDGEGDKKDGDKKEGDKKDEGPESKDADKKDAKEGDKKDAKSTDKKDGDKKDGDKKDAKDAKDGDKKTDDKKDGEKKEEVKYLPYNPIRESINLLNTNRLAESLDLLTREIKKSPKNAQAYYVRALVQVKMRQYDKAAADYNEVLKLTPTGELATRAKMGLTKIRF